MVRFFELGEGETHAYWYEREGQVFPLHNDNFVANLHEVLDMEMNIQETADAVYDRVCVEDPEDGQYWIHWRVDHDPEEWMSIEFVARRCGSLLIRQTALPTVVEHFNSRFCADVEVEELFVPDEWEESDEPS